MGAKGAVIDIHEAAGLLAVAPDVDFVFAAKFGLDDFSADGGGGFFAASVPCAVGAVDVVVAGVAGVEAEVFAEVAAHALAEEFFPAVAVFWHGGVGVGFFEAGVGGVGLFFAVIDAGAGGVEELVDAVVAGGHEHVGVDEDAEHAEGFVVFDEAHAAHVGGEVVDDFGVFADELAGVDALDVHDEVFDVSVELIPVVEGFLVDGADVGVSLLLEEFDEVAADESAGSGDDCFAFQVVILVGVVWLGWFGRMGEGE